jgi:hypothetical protein
MNNPVPVKLLPAGANRNQLMKVIGEKTTTFSSDDYIERIAGQDWWRRTRTSPNPSRY